MGTFRMRSFFALCFVLLFVSGPVSAFWGDADSDGDGIKDSADDDDDNDGLLDTEDADDDGDGIEDEDEDHDGDGEGKCLGTGVDVSDGVRSQSRQGCRLN